ncbi:MAG TPA: IS66 family transposase [Steroidobacteraceae bacterium]|nr:IS66 family transposase [Steroidobacteraceae bacterium]
MSRKSKRQRRSPPLGAELQTGELGAIAERAMTGAISAEEYAKLKALIDTFDLLKAELLAKQTSVDRLRAMLFGAATEKTSAVLGEESAQDAPEDDKAETRSERKGHGRNGAAAYTGARKVRVPHPSLHSGDSCPCCSKGRIYPVTEPAKLVRVTAVAPLQATVYECDRLRCGLCGEMYTAAAPEGVGQEKYDASATGMVAMIKYGAGMPFNRVERLQEGMGIPLPAATQWDLVKNAAETLSPVHRELVRQAAQGTVLHNDDTTMTILKLTPQQRASALGKDAKQSRTGVFTSGIVSIGEGREIALFFTGARHAGENLAEVLKRRAAELPVPIQMCDGLSRNVPSEFETLLGKCMVHARRNYVEVEASFPEEVRFVLLTLREVYKTDARARKEGLTPEERLQLHKDESGPRMKTLATWMEDQFKQRKVEPNSTLGDAIQYMTDHWEGLTLFLRAAGAPLDNNVCERVLKKAILHRKNALFYRTLNGAHVGDLFMSLIHTAELARINVFDYLTTMLRHPEKISTHPEQWMPWNYRATLTRLSGADPPA